LRQRRHPDPKGAIKRSIGEALGDSKLTAGGVSDEIEGRMQTAVVGAKDALKR
jgi:uncharacterized protein YjbJ (UPF0337 family)